MAGEELGEQIGTGFTVYEQGTAILNVFLLLMGAQIDLNDNKGGIIHFRHDRNDKAQDIQMRAVAYFHSTIARNRIACYGLAGIEVPPPGPLAGFKVRWSIKQPRYDAIHGKYLQASRDESNKVCEFGTCGDITGADGVSTLNLFPPRELNPPPDYDTEPLQRGYAWVTAGLEKEDFPFKMGDLLSLNKAGSFAVSKLIDIALSALQKGGLPSQTRRVRVDYHGNEIYIVRGTNHLFLFAVSFPVELDIYTCNGLAGPWKGSGGLGPSVNTPILDEAAALTGASIPPEGLTYIRPLNFTIDPKAEEPSFVILPETELTGVFHIDPYHLYSTRRENIYIDARKAGEVEVLIPGNVIPDFLQSSHTIYHVPEYHLCPPGGYDYGN